MGGRNALENSIK